VNNRTPVVPPVELALLVSCSTASMRAQKAWVRSFYARDFADPVIGLASQGAVLRHDKAMGKYVEIKGLGRREAEQARATEMKGGPRNPPSSRSEVGQERNAKGKGHHG